MVTLIYANRNKEIEQIKASLDSLQFQFFSEFEVVFVDYGSDKAVIPHLENLLDSYSFAKFFALRVPQLLWNKSKALNYAIIKASNPNIFIADVDLIFHPDTTNLLRKLAVPGNFYLFELAYLENKVPVTITKIEDVAALKPSRRGNVNGMVLTSKKALMEVNGLDEFFHFYGGEDVDLFARLENAGYKRKAVDEPYFFHNWHQTFSGLEDKLLTGNPRIRNIMRINQRHFFRNRETGITRPVRQIGMGKIIDKDKSNLLLQPTRTYQISNILAHVEHFLKEELPGSKGEIVKVEFIEDPYYDSLKYKIKTILGKQTQLYCSMKEVNDIVLKEILFNYRDSNYSFSISNDLKAITFCIQNI